MFLTINSIGEKILKNKTSKSKRIKEFNNFETARSIGILFEASNQNLFLEAKTFIHFCRQKAKNVEALGFVLADEFLDYFPKEKGVNYFNFKKRDIFGLPKCDVIREFTEKKFDILIDISMHNDLAVRYILATSKAKLKISAQYSLDYADFVFKVKQDTQVNEFVEIITHYLKNLKTK